MLYFTCAKSKYENEFSAKGNDNDIKKSITVAVNKMLYEMCKI